MCFSPSLGIPSNVSIQVSLTIVTDIYGDVCVWCGVCVCVCVCVPISSPCVCVSIFLHFSLTSLPDISGS